MYSSTALNLLAEYGGDSSDEDVPGVRVSTKRQHKDDSDDERAYKRLPLPDVLKTQVKNVDVVDDPALHDGRLRSFPHERGNWATFVFIPFESEVDLSEIVNNLLQPLQRFDLKASNDFHISLTRTVTLRHHWIEPFVQSIKENLSHVRRFALIFSGLKVYCNDERTRTFIGLQTITGVDTLNNAIDILNKCLRDFQLPPFYMNPSFHMSIAWCTGDREQELNSCVPELNEYLQEVLLKVGVSNLFTYVQYLCCKSGNKMFHFPLT